jgi:hypothetical protein
MEMSTMIGCGGGDDDDDDDEDDNDDDDDDNDDDDDDNDGDDDDDDDDYDADDDDNDDDDDNGGDDDDNDDDDNDDDDESVFDRSQPSAGTQPPTSKQQGQKMARNKMALTQSCCSTLHCTLEAIQHRNVEGGGGLASTRIRRSAWQEVSR